MAVSALWTAALAHEDDSHKLYDLGDFSLESGAVLPSAKLSYVTHGTLNADRSNAILTPSAYSGNHHGLDHLIGPGKALDTDEYFIVATDMFASGLSSSPSNTPPPFDGPRFPKISTRDNVNAGYKLATEAFGIEHLHAVVGFSMGSQQALQWAISYPDYVSKVIPFCGSAKEYPHGIARLEGFKSALMTDAAFLDGEYDEPPTSGLEAAGMHWAGWGFSQEWYRHGMYSVYGHEDLEEHLDKFWRVAFLDKDANDLISQAVTWQTNNVGNSRGFDGDHEAALKSISASVLYIACETDMYFHINALENEASRIPGAEFAVLPSLAGHIAGSGDRPEDLRFLDERIDAFLDLDDYSELDIDALQSMMESGELTAEMLARFYIHRIGKIDKSGPALNSIIEINPDALDIARALDAERQSSGPRSSMHGIPVVLKANIDTADKMETTAGSLALDGHIPPRDAFLVEGLREAGAVILAKANLSEWANFRSSNSVSGWSSIGGQTHNPYDTSRNPCGSSSGSGVSVSANLTSVAIGTETDGSVVCPASINGVVGIKPTLGLVSRSGIIPIAHSQDTAGPMGRTVKDAAILLNAMVGRDAEDPLADEYPNDVADFAFNLISSGPKHRSGRSPKSSRSTARTPTASCRFSSRKSWKQPRKRVH
jgi:homoserine O-acetyltransferase